MHMSLRALIASATTCVLVGLATQSSFAQVLYSQSFDANDQTGLWSVNTGGTTDKHVDLFYDYSAVGIPAAPHSTGGSTRGMKLQANLTANAFGGINVSPIGKSFAGNYKLTFDVWANFIGAEVGSAASANTDGLWEGGASSTKYSEFGILSSGTGDNYRGAATGAVPGSNWAGVAEALYFSATGDGQGSFDYNVQGPGDPNVDHGPGGFRSTTETSATGANLYRNYDATKDVGVNYADTYPVGHPDAGETNRGVSFDPDVPFDMNDTNVTDGFLYQQAFPPVSAPGQAALYPSTQFDTTMPGAFGMAWRQVEIKKVGNLVTWSVLNAGANSDQTFVLATVDLSLLKVPATSGTNIMFGESDPTSNIGTDPDFAALQFTLIDNVRVESVAAPAQDADFNNDGIVDGADFIVWQRGQGAAGNNGAGDANGDGNVNAADLAIWKTKFGGPTVGAVPEPASAVLVAFTGVTLLSSARRRK
jgi:hypothetical protein